MTAALLGPSAAQPPLGHHDDAATPPWHLSSQPAPWLVTLLLAVAVVAGVSAVWLGLTGRWQPRPARLVAVGALVVAGLALLPPIGSADPLSYAAYGHAAATGHDPYTTTPLHRAAAGDPVAAAVEVPWRDTPSVYGPVATAEQAAAAAVGGRDVAMTVLVLDLLGALAFAVVGLLLLWRAPDDAARARAALLWWGNPLVWLEAVAGAHLDVVVAGFAVAAVLAARRSPLLSGLLGGIAAAVKPPGGLVVVAAVWTARHRWRAAATTAVAALAVGVAAYAVAGTAALNQLSRASRMVSLATPWRPVLDLTHSPRRLIGALAAVLFVVVVAALVRSRPRPAATVAGLSYVLTLAYVLAAPYALPWYDVLPWALAPLAIASWRDKVLLAHTGVLALAYLPGRAAVQLHGGLETLTHGMRALLAPALLTLLLLWVLLAVRRSTVTAR